MRIACYICHTKRKTFANAMENFESYDSYQLQTHIETEHTIDDVVKFFTISHWDMIGLPTAPGDWRGNK